MQVVHTLPETKRVTGVSHDGVAHTAFSRTRVASSLRNRAARLSALQMLHAANHDDNGGVLVAPPTPPCRTHHGASDAARLLCTPLQFPHTMPQSQGDALASAALDEAKRCQVQEWLRAIDPQPLVPPELAPVVTFFRRVQEEWMQKQRDASAVAKPGAATADDTAGQPVHDKDDAPDPASPVTAKTMTNTPMTLSSWLESALRLDSRDDGAEECLGMAGEVDAWGNDVPLFAACCEHLLLTTTPTTRCDTQPPRPAVVAAVRHPPCSVVQSFSRSAVPSGTVPPREDTQCGPTPSQYSLRDTRHSYTRSGPLSQLVLCPRTANGERSTSFIEMVHTG